MGYLLLAVKVGLSAILLSMLVYNIDFTQVQSIIYSSTGCITFVAAVSIIILQTIVAGIRLKLVLEIFQIKVTSLAGIKLWFVGNLFSQIFLSFIGGDAMRLLSLTRSGNEYGASARAIFIDRVLSFISLQILYFFSIIFLMKILHDKNILFVIIFLGIFSIAAIITFLALGAIPEKFHKLRYVGKVLDLVATSRYIYLNKRKTLLIMSLNIIVHMGNIWAIYAISRLLNVDLSFFKVMVVGIPCMYISMLPISIGGWGFRENSMVVGLALYGISSEVALSISIIWGISLLIASIPGVAVLWQKDYSKMKTLQVAN